MIDDLTDELERFSSWYPTKNLYVFMGDDFMYRTDGQGKFDKIDRIIFNLEKMKTKNGVKLNAAYSTPSYYLSKINGVNK